MKCAHVRQVPIYCQETHDGPISTEMLFGRCVAHEEYELMLQRERRGGAR